MATSLSNLFTPGWTTNASTTNTLYVSGNATSMASGSQLAYGWSEPTMTKAKEGPLDWLHREVGRYVELGTLVD